MLSRKTKNAIKALIALLSTARTRRCGSPTWPGSNKIPPSSSTIRRAQEPGHSAEPEKGRVAGICWRVIRAPSIWARSCGMFDGPLAPVPCASQTAYVPCSDCPNEAVCGVHLAMKKVRDATAKILDGTSLAQLLRQIDNASLIATS